MSIQTQTQINTDQPPKDAPTENRNRLWWGLAIGLLLFSLLLRLAYINERLLSYDEGHLLMFGMLAGKGFKPYTDIFVGMPPLAMLAFQAAAAWFGTSVYIRIPVILSSLMGVAAIFWVVKLQAQQHAMLAACLAAIFLSVGPRYFPDSITLVTDVPAVALAVLSLALAQQYQATPKYYWLVLSGISFVLSVGFKILVIFLPVIIGIQLVLIAFAGESNPLSARSAYLKLIKMGLAWTAGVVLALGFFIILYDPLAMYREAIAFRLRLLKLPLFSQEHIEEFLDVFDDEDRRLTPLVLLSLLPFALTDVRRWWQFWPWLLWLILAGLFLFRHEPLRPRHLAMLIPPLAALSAIGLAQLLPLLYNHLQPQISKGKAVAICALLVWLMFGPLEYIKDIDREDFDLTKRPDLAAVTTLIERLTSPADYIIVDDQRFALYTKRFVPPYLSETSLARIRADGITPEDVRREATNYHAPILMITAFRLNLVAGVTDVGEDRYAVRLLYRDEAEEQMMSVYAIETNTAQQPDRPLEASLGGQVWLKGVDLFPLSWRTGREIAVSTYWQAQKRIGQDYKIFIHLLNAQGELVSQFDHYPFQIELSPTLKDIKLNEQYKQIRPLEELSNYPNAGLVPTRIWRPDQTLRETMTASLPETLPAGTYSILIGLYDEATGERLSLDGSPDGQTAVLLEKIEIKN